MSLDLFKGEEEKKATISTYSNPFHPDKVKSIHIWIQKGVWSPYPVEHKATIEFKNGDTSGEHRIVAEDFPQLLEKIETFIKNL